MPDSSARRIVRIGVFYDGYYFSHVSNYYYYHHFNSRMTFVRGRCFPDSNSALTI